MTTPTDPQTVQVRLLARDGCSQDLYLPPEMVQDHQPLGLPLRMPATTAVVDEMEIPYRIYCWHETVRRPEKGPVYCYREAFDGDTAPRAMWTLNRPAGFRGIEVTP